MKNLRQAIEKVFTMVDEIAASSLQESDRLAQISSTMHQLDGMTQENAALVEQAAGASGLLEEQADRLQQIVAEFKLRPSIQPSTSPQTVHVNKLEYCP